MSYVTATEVYNTTGITSAVVGQTIVEQFISAAEAEIDRYTRTTYWNVENTGTASSGGNTTLVDTGIGWTVNAYSNWWVWVYSGLGSGQVRQIVSNTADTLTVDRAWATNPDATSLYRIIYCATDPMILESYDGNSEVYFYVPHYPIQLVETLAIDSTTVTPSTLYTYSKMGKLQLGPLSEEPTFTEYPPQAVALRYFHGVYPLPREVKRAVELLAGIKTLTAQIGGTFDDPSSIQMPEASVTVGQAYINIKSGLDLLQKEFDEAKKILTVYNAVA